MSFNNKRVEIPISKTKTILAILGCLVFVILSIWLWINAYEVRGSPLMTRVMSIVGFCFFGFGLILGTKKLFDKRPGLVIDDDGILDNTSIAAGRFTSWSNITGFEVMKIRSNKILLININNANDLIGKESAWKQKIMRYSNRVYGTPISITSSGLKIGFNDLEKLLLERHKDAIAKLANN